MSLVLHQVSELDEEQDCINDVLEKMEAALVQLDAMPDLKIPAIHLHQAIEALRNK